MLVLGVLILLDNTVILRFCFRRSKLKVKILFSAAIARPKASHHLAHRSPQHPAIDSGPKWVEVQKKIQYEVYDDVNNKMVQLKALINISPPKNRKWFVTEIGFLPKTSCQLANGISQIFVLKYLLPKTVHQMNMAI